MELGCVELTRFVNDDYNDDDNDVNFDDGSHINYDDCDVSRVNVIFCSEMEWF